MGNVGHYSSESLDVNFDTETWRAEGTFSEERAALLERRLHETTLLKYQYNQIGM